MSDLANPPMLAYGLLAAGLALAAALLVWLSRRALARRGDILAWLARRVTAGSYLSLHLAAGILVSLVSLGAFASIAEDVVEGRRLLQFDQSVAQRLHASATPAGIAFFRLVTHLGDPILIAIVALGVGLAMLRLGSHLLAGWWAAAMAGAFLLTNVLKAFFQRPRPSFADPIVTLQTWSFPSGHALGAFIFYGMLAYLATRWLRSSWARALAVAGAVALVVLIGLSRMYLGAHYLSDVAAAFAAGSVWLSACITGLEVASRRRAAAPPAEQAPLSPPARRRGSG